MLSFSEQLLTRIAHAMRVFFARVILTGVVRSNACHQLILDRW